MLNTRRAYRRIKNGNKIGLRMTHALVANTQHKVAALELNLADAWPVNKRKTRQQNQTTCNRQMRDGMENWIRNAQEQWPVLFSVPTTRDKTYGPTRSAIDKESFCHYRPQVHTSVILPRHNHFLSFFLFHVHQRLAFWSVALPEEREKPVSAGEVKWKLGTRTSPGKTCVYCTETNLVRFSSVIIFRLFSLLSFFFLSSRWRVACDLSFSPKLFDWNVFEGR